MKELFGHWLDRGPKPKPKATRPLPGQRPLFDECTPELTTFGGRRVTQGVLFTPPESPDESAQSEGDKP